VRELPASKDVKSRTQRRLSNWTATAKSFKTDKTSIKRRNAKDTDHIGLSLDKY
jgi:hypothetical protein